MTNEIRAARLRNRIAAPGRCNARMRDHLSSDALAFTAVVLALVAILTLAG
jgi:hypothetical protein